MQPAVRLASAVRSARHARRAISSARTDAVVEALQAQRRAAEREVAAEVAAMQAHCSTSAGDCMMDLCITQRRKIDELRCELAARVAAAHTKPAPWGGSIHDVVAWAALDLWRRHAAQDRAPPSDDAVAAVLDAALEDEARGFPLHAFAHGLRWYLEACAADNELDAGVTMDAARDAPRQLRRLLPALTPGAAAPDGKLQGPGVLTPLHVAVAGIGFAAGVNVCAHRQGGPFEGVRLRVPPVDSSTWDPAVLKKMPVVELSRHWGRCWW